MKKITPVAIIAFIGLLSFTACKKDYSCKCTTTVQGQTGDTTIALGKLKKKDAESKCDGYQTTWQPIATALGATSFGCEVK